ncbi:MAG TPA: hypothetical protein VG370_29675 [Chloroflexota bacterium]|nr:hypothetical protein [Chloroflexota bacterium]
MPTRLAGSALGLVALLVAVVAPAQPAAAPPRPEPPPSRLGVHMLLSEGVTPWPARAWREHLGLAAESLGPGGYVVQVLSDGNRDPARWQALMAGARRHGLRPIVRLATRYDRKARFWRAPQVDRTRTSYRRVAAGYRVFLDALRWPPGERIVIVGNEPNRGDEWGDRPDPAAYVRFLRDVAAELRPAGYTVLNAALDPYCPNTNGARIDRVRYVDAESFLDGMRRAEPAFHTWIDGWASHAYPQGPFAAPPGEQSFKIDLLNGAANPDHLAPDPGVVNRGVNGYAFELQKLASYGAAALPVWVTETGWRHRESPVASRDAHGAVLTHQEVAERMRQALVGPGEGFTPWLSDPRVRVVVFFGFDGDPRHWGHSSWLEMSPDGQVRGRYAPFDVLRGLGLPSRAPLLSS